ncbi:putative NAD dependent epimerase/dehydratase family protein [Legionella gratiana]|uniref:NAD dependent epimerase/dehydratase family protein n=1 Tax=Legionella gratiana TaxID=45066 RepID=A0A378J0G3_9GAMM|nr:NAD(P)-dependent oxidoreductase [Legionella gratiana]KTD11585.1 putative NAD dependent epimerase/dehydratase family protein [Legionella gratiana]STX41212.1 putative NAD dependent epimerase/dehydratase family protein [Legionella gratiana]
MLKVAITGANSFIGSHLIEKLSSLNVTINALYRNAPRMNNHYNNVHFYSGNLLESATLKDFIKGCDVVINLSYLWEHDCTQNLEAIRNLADTCVSHKIKRFIHCSTTSVYGTVVINSVDEDTPCNPQTEYAKTKFALENYLLEHYISSFEIMILRPTQVFGPRGKNLLKLADDLIKGSSLKNYLKSSLMAKKPMNLVCVDNVVGAIEYLVYLKKSNKFIYIVSDDDAKANNFHQVESYLMSQLKIPDYFFPYCSLPLFLYKNLSRIMGKGSINPKTIYYGKNLTDAGYIKPVKFEDGLAKFMEWYKLRIGNKVR